VLTLTALSNFVNVTFEKVFCYNVLIIFKSSMLHG
jgi:hypothetical protein